MVSLYGFPFKKAFKKDRNPFKKPLKRIGIPYKGIFKRIGTLKKALKKVPYGYPA